MKYLLIGLSILLASPEVNSIEYPGFKLQVFDGPGVQKTARFKWYGSHKGTPSFDKHFWSENGFGSKYLTDKFGLKDYSLNIKDVYVTQGFNYANKYGQSKQYTHYVPHKTQNKYCLIHVHWAKGTSSTADNGFTATLIGCFDVSKP